jgi:hypothetical protein
MTTIVFDVKAKKVATDSRVTEDGAIVADDATKMHIRKGVMFFLCGGVGDAEELMMAYLQKKHRVRKTMEAQGLAWDGINLIELCVDSGLLTWHPVVSDRGAYGSGSPFAVAALDQGATPRQAVIAAKKRDTCTGGKVVTYRLRRKV